MAGRRPPVHAASTSTCGSSAGGASTRCVGPRSPSRARWSGAPPTSRRASGGRRSATASSSITTRTRRTARSPRRGPCGPRPTRACRCLSSGTRSRIAIRPRSRSSTAPARFAERGDAAAGIDASAGSLDGLLALSAAQEAEGLGDAPWPPHYKKQGGEPPRVAPSKRRKPPGGGRVAHGPAPLDPAARHGGEGEARGRGARRPRALEGAPSERRRPGSRPTTSSSTRCAGDPAHGRGSA